MPAPLIRLGVLLLTLLLIAALVQGGRLFVARQRRLALAAEPLRDLPPGNRLRILAFGSADCSQCHTLQEPTLRRLQALRGPEIEVVEIDAPASPDLAGRYHILTLPSTVLLNPAGEPLAVNYGFANLEKLQAQIDAVLCTSR
jgi:hypothetical protein